MRGTTCVTLLALFLGCLSVAATPPGSGEPVVADYLAFDATFLPTDAAGGQYLVIQPGPAVRKALWIRSEPSLQVLGAIAQEDFFGSGEGKQWSAALGYRQIMVVGRAFDGEARFQIHLAGQPEGDDVLTFVLEGFDVPPFVRDPSEGEAAFRISRGARSGPQHIRISKGFNQPSLKGAFLEAGDCQCGGAYTAVTCYGEYGSCTNCVCCKSSDVYGCCGSADGDQGCNPGGNWGCLYNKATCGYCPMCGG